jgi:hypothetical protein
MRIVFASLSLALFACVGSALAQQAPPPAPNQLTPQVLGEMLASATTFHDLVTSLNLSRSLGPDVHVEGPDGEYHHPVRRTAAVIGAGVGAGAAIGGMTRSLNGVMIGALVGGAGGLIIDQIMRHREEVREHAAYGPPAPAYDRDERRLKER